MKAPPPGSFMYHALYMDPDDGAVDLHGEVLPRGARVVHTDGDIAGGPRYYVVRVPGHRYSGLRDSAYAPARFVVYEAAYGGDPAAHDLRIADEPWVRVRQALAFSVLAGTKGQVA